MMVRQRFNKLSSPPVTSNPAFAWLLVALYCLIIFVQSAFPTPGDLPGFPGIDKLAHLLIYFLLGLLFARAYGLSLPAPTARSLFLLAWFSAILYGASDEVHQSFVAARSADPLDWLADIAGGGLGAALYLRLKGRRRRDA